MKSMITLILISGLQLGCSMFGSRTEETARYQVLESDGQFEIRQYSSVVIAKTEVTGDYKSSQSEAFKILAGYIFGGNQTKTKIAMTAPVEQTQKPSSIKIAMTAPVTQTKSDSGWVMTFMMPSKFKLEDLPVPNDSRVQLEQVPAKTVAALRFSGSRSEEANVKKAEELKSWIQNRGSFEIVPTANLARSAGYDPPWTLPPFRRNEVMFDVRKIEVK